ncbi:hypothetical protein QWZ13_11820 [Reinekea marina]|nr:hypothetical protein [Reinekea marina]MDN3649604.1 hypothetical protein [Reinekea marina]
MVHPVKSINVKIKARYFISLTFLNYGEIARSVIESKASHEVAFWPE